MVKTIFIPPSGASLFRVIDPSDYNPETGRFNSTALRNSTNGGISVVEFACAEEKSESLCQHIREFYEANTKPPGYFLPIWDDAIPSDCVVDDSEPSTTGDECHRNIQYWAPKDVRRYIIKRVLSDFMICEKGTPRRLTLADLESEEFRT